MAAEVLGGRVQNLQGHWVLRLIVVALSVDVHVERNDLVGVDGHSAQSSSGGSTTPDPGAIALNCASH